MRIEELERELRAEREEPSQDFARRLDEWAAEGFPRDRGLGPRFRARRGPLGRAWDRLTSVPPRRILMPAGAIATVAVVAGVALSRPEPEPTSLTVPTQPAGQTAPTPDAATGVAPQEQAAPPAAAAGSAAGAAAPGQAGGFDLSAPSGADSVARGADKRLVDATAQLSLGADADEVQDVANQVVDVTDRYDGVVLDSEVTSDQAGARASFQLEIPYKHLDAALSDLSGLADVISRTEGGQDITAHAVRARKDLAQTLDRLRSARVALIRADTREQRLVIKSQINSLKATARAQLTELRGVKRQSRFATVSVDVTSTAGSADDGNWGLDDAIDDAGNVLETIGGIALVSLAILLPLSLLVALIALVISRGRRRSRDRALGG